MLAMTANFGSIHQTICSFSVMAYKIYIVETLLEEAPNAKVIFIVQGTYLAASVFQGGLETTAISHVQKAHGAQDAAYHAQTITSSVTDLMGSNDLNNIVCKCFPGNKTRKAIKFYGGWNVKQTTYDQGRINKGTGVNCSVSPWPRGSFFTNTTIKTLGFLLKLLFVKKKETSI